MSTSELAMTYAALILHDDGIPVTADKLSSIAKAAGVTVEPYWPGLFAKFLESKDMGDLIGNVGSGGGAPAAAAPAGGGGGGGGGAPAAKEPEPEEEEEDMGFDLFD